MSKQPMFKAQYKIESIVNGKQFVLKEEFNGETIVLGKFKTQKEAEDYSKTIDESRVVFRGDYAG